MERGFDSGCVDPRVRHSLPHLRGQGACSKFLVSMVLSVGLVCRAVLCASGCCSGVGWSRGQALGEQRIE